MGSHQHFEPCPQCGRDMEVTRTTVPIDLYALCLHCGFEAYTTYCQHDLESLNGHRADRDMRPLKKLAKIRHRWAPEETDAED